MDWILLCALTAIKYLALLCMPFAGTALSKKFFPKIADILKWLPCSSLNRESIAIIDHFRHKEDFASVWRVNY